MGILVIGTSNTSWNGIPLPLAVPGRPGCFFYTDRLAMIAFGVNGSGNGGVPLTMPNDRSLVGGHVFTQAIVISPLGASVQYSNAIDTLIGGFR